MAKSSEFVAQLQAAITGNPSVEPLLAERAIAVINGKRSIKRTLILNAMERHARQLGSNQQHVPMEAVDLSKIDWMAVLGLLLRLLLLFAL